MITIKCTESEKRKLCKDETNIMCNICYTLGACKEFDARCDKCKRHRGKYIKWDIQKSKAKKKVVKEEKSCFTCHWKESCHWSNDGACGNSKSPYYQNNVAYMAHKELDKTCPGYEKDHRGCRNCYWSSYIRGSKVPDGCCRNKKSPYYGMDADEIHKLHGHCDLYSAYEGDG